MAGPARDWLPQLRASLWCTPAAAGVLALVGTLALNTVRPAPTTPLAEWTWPTDSSTASSLLQTVATASITALTLTLSLTVVALQLASQQFSPRLLRSFARDGVVRATMAVLVSALVVSLTTLRGLDPEQPLPVLGLLASFLLGLASAGMLVAFMAHIVGRLRVDDMMAAVHRDAVAAMLESYAEYGTGPEAPDDVPEDPTGAVVLPARRSGFVRTIDPHRLGEVARRHRVLLHVGIRPGDSVVVGSPVARAVDQGGGGVRVDDLVADMDGAVAVGFERTEEQDAAFGLRQLVDIAIKAISPGVNDPTTAAEALEYCADLLVRLTGRRLGAQLHRDDDGTPRLVLPDRDLPYYLDLACGQVRRFGAGMPEVLTAVLRLLRDVALATRDDDQRAAVALQAALVLEQMSDDLLDHDQAAVRDMARRVSLALAADPADAYRDRAGETRSI